MPRCRWVKCTGNNCKAAQECTYHKPNLLDLELYNKGGGHMICRNMTLVRVGKLERALSHY